MAVGQVDGTVSADVVNSVTLASAASKPRRPWWARFKSRNLIIGGTILLALVLAAIFAPVIAPYDPLEQNTRNALQSPSRDHLFGTDNFGRDMFSRVIWGARIDLRVGAIAVIMPFVI